MGVGPTVHPLNWGVFALELAEGRTLSTWDLEARCLQGRRWNWVVLGWIPRTSVPNTLGVSEHMWDNLNTRWANCDRF